MAKKKSSEHQMSSSFTFVPRKVQAKNAKTQGSSSTTRISASRRTAGSANTSALKAFSSVKGKEKATENTSKLLFTEQDYVSLISMALSDYALWSDSDLRRIVEQHPEQFIPLSQLLRHSPVLSLAGLGPTEETNVGKAIRLHASDILDVRMLVSDLSWSRSKQEEHSGLYEIRRRDWEIMRTQALTRNDWEARTIYMENIPPQYRTLAGIIKVIIGLLPQSENVPEQYRIQRIVLPPHYRDKPTDHPKCKGFALITLRDLQDVEILLDDWPWEPCSVRIERAENSSLDVDIANEATKFGVRAISKKRWEELKDEYLAYQRRLLDELIAHNEESNILPQERNIEDDEFYSSAPAPTAAPSESLVKTTLDSPYPIDCLVFVRNVHPETNKTTLRKLFATAFEGDGLDYVDFNKGMDSCYLRLASPRHTSILMDHFTSHPTAQTRGLDDMGTSPAGTHAGLVIEIVQGKKEELYWEKVPEKVRRQAVQKAISELQAKELLLDEDVTMNSNGRKRKRDK